MRTEMHTVRYDLNQDRVVWFTAQITIAEIPREPSLVGILNSLNTSHFTASKVSPQKLTHRVCDTCGGMISVENIRKVGVRSYVCFDCKPKGHRRSPDRSM